MHENVPVRFGRGRLDSLEIKGLAAYLITSFSANRCRDWTCKHGLFLLLGLDSRGLHRTPHVSRSNLLIIM